MFITDKAIVLHLSKYSDKASILHVYTQQFGRMAYMVYGLHSKAGKVRAAVFEPMNLIEITANHVPNKSIQQLQSAHLLFVPNETRTDMIRRSVSLFMAEILYRTLLYPMADEPLFAWLNTQVKALEHDAAPENVHVRFLVQLTEYLGIMPDFEEQEPIWSDLYSTTEVHLTRQERQSLLRKLCRYYELHIADFQTPASLAILETIFD